MTEYRVTRPYSYEFGTKAYVDPSSRQGYYADADSPEQAAQIVAGRFKEINKVEIALDVQPAIIGRSWEDLAVVHHCQRRDGIWRVVRTTRK